MRAKEIRERSDEELGRMLKEAKEGLFRLRFKNATHQLDDTSQIRRGRREIARISTVIQERKRNLGGGDAEAAKDKESEE